MYMEMLKIGCESYLKMCTFVKPMLKNYVKRKLLLEKCDKVHLIDEIHVQKSIPICERMQKLYFTELKIKDFTVK